MAKAHFGALTTVRPPRLAVSVLGSEAGSRGFDASKVCARGRAPTSPVSQGIELPRGARAPFSRCHCRATAMAASGKGLDDVLEVFRRHDTSRRGDGTISANEIQRVLTSVTGSDFWTAARVQRLTSSNPHERVDIASFINSLRSASAQPETSSSGATPSQADTAEEPAPTDEPPDPPAPVPEENAYTSKARARDHTETERCWQIVRCLGGTPA